MKNRSIFICILFCTRFVSCVYDLDIPLTNNHPKCTSHEQIETTVYYPDDFVANLSISDLNDETVTLSAWACDTGESQCDSVIEVLWPGTYSYIKNGYGTKLITLSLDTNLMGIFSGMLIIRDSYNALSSLPYRVQKLFFEPFDTYPLSENYWKKYHQGETTTIGYHYVDKKLLFSFDEDDSTKLLSTGIISFFALSGDFHITIDFRLKDEMNDGFEIGFFVSTSSDTGKWDGDRAGIFIQGKQAQIRMECSSIEMQTYSRDLNLTSGELGISRQGQRLSYYYHDGNPLVSPESPISHTYVYDSVFVHLKMSVTDRTRNHHVSWNDFYITRGFLVF